MCDWTESQVPFSEGIVDRFISKLHWIFLRPSLYNIHLFLTIIRF